METGLVIRALVAVVGSAIFFWLGFKDLRLVLRHRRIKKSGAAMEAEAIRVSNDGIAGGKAVRDVHCIFDVHVHPTNDDPYPATARLRLNEFTAAKLGPGTWFLGKFDPNAPREIILTQVKSGSGPGIELVDKSINELGPWILFSLMGLPLALVLGWTLFVPVVFAVGVVLIGLVRTLLDRKRDQSGEKEPAWGDDPSHFPRRRP